ncbi:hypothetical protein [Natrialba hulunbeirensis]|nr:hypothetical protein [Natrialba hulunbeirensis]
MSPSRRRFLLGATGLTGATAGCLSYVRRVSPGLSIGSSYPDEIALEIEIAPDYGEDPVFTDRIVIDGEESRIERDEVVTGWYGDEFFVSVKPEPAPELLDDVFHTYWELTCVGNDRIEDHLRILVTEWKEIRLRPNRCS